MGARGPKPKPTALRLIEGNRGRLPINRNEPTPPVAEPEPPDHLNAVALAEWRRVAPVLAACRLLTELDRSALAAYCQDYARWVEAERKLATTQPLIPTPSGYIQQNPWLSISNRAQEMMQRRAGELGMTPASRCRIDAGPQPAPAMPGGKFAGLLGLPGHKPSSGSSKD